MGRSGLQKGGPGRGVFAEPVAIEAKTTDGSLVHRPAQQAGGQGRSEIDHRARRRQPGIAEPGIQFRQCFGPPPVEHGQQTRARQDVNLVHIAQQGRGTLKGIQAGQLHAPPRARRPLKTGWVCNRSPKRVKFITRVCISILEQKACQKARAQGPAWTNADDRQSPLSRISFLYDSKRDAVLMAVATKARKEKKMSVILRTSHLS